MGNLINIAGRFKPQSRIIDIKEFGSGNINSTYLVTTVSENSKHFILQRINTQVFRKPDLVMSNMRISTAHILSRFENLSYIQGRRFEVPIIISAENGHDFWTDSAGNFWRALSFIESTETFDTIKNTSHAREVGYALGLFHNLLSDLSPDRLADTLEGFHITPIYLQRYDEVLDKYSKSKSHDINYCIEFINSRRALAHILEDAKANGKLLVRTIHGDPKVNNILIDTGTTKAVGVVDLDTVKPGLVHYDIGDCLRSGCNPMGEEIQEWEKARFDTNFCKSILEGYLSSGREFLTDNDFKYIYDSIRLIAFELGLRFFTDYLEGNVYFKVNRPDHNLFRALVQFKLAESIEAQESTIRKIIQDLR